MMQITIFTALLIMLVIPISACQHFNETTKHTNNHGSHSQNIANKSNNSSHQAAAKQIQAGDIKVQQLLSNFPVFEKNYQTYPLDKTEQSIIKQWPNNLNIDVYFGTWCHDSEREVPRLLKIVEDHPHISLNLITLDYQKSEPQGRAMANKIKYTPTFIVYQNNQEIGRVIERPKVSLIADINEFIQ